MVEMLNEEEEDENGSGEDSVNFEDVIRSSYTLASFLVLLDDNVYSHR
jgi:hypothetical protein